MKQGIKHILFEISRESEEVFDLVHEESTDGFWLWDLQNKEHIWYSPVFLKTLGFNNKSQKNACLQLGEILHEDDFAFLLDTLKSIKINNGIELPLRYKTLSGSEIKLISKLYVAVLEKDKSRWLIGAHRDSQTLDNILSYRKLQGNAKTLEKEVANRLKTENALKQSEQNYRLLFENNPQPMWVYDLETLNFLQFNEAAIQKYGYTRDEFLQLNIKDIRPPEDIDKLLENINNDEDELSYSGEWRHKTKSGDNFWVEIISHKINYGNRNAKLVLLNDITQRRQAEEELVNSERLLNEAQKITKMGSWNFDFRNDSLIWSDGLYDVFDVDRETFKDTHGSFLGLIDEEDRERALKTSKQTQETGEPFHIIYRITTPKGEKRFIEEYGFAEKDEQGNVVRLFGTAQNVTERLKLQEDSKNAERIFKYSTEMLCMVGFDGYFKAVNPAWNKCLGWSEKELLSKPYINFVHPHDKEKTIKEGDRVLKGEGSAGFENRYVCKDGSQKLLLWNSYVFPKEKVIYAVVSDVTELRKKEQQLKESEKLFKTLFDNAPVSILVHDLITGEVIDANERAWTVYGLKSLKELQENEFWLESPYSFKEAKAKIDEAVREGYTQFEWKSKNVNGEFFWELVTLRPININEDDKILSVAIDITEKKAIEESLKDNELKLRNTNALFEYVIEHANSAVAILDNKLHFVYVSERFKKDFKVQDETIIGRHHYDVFPDLPQKWRDIHARVLQGEILHDDADEYIRENGEEIYTRWECRPWYVSDGQIGGIVLYTAVITEEIFRERELKKLSTAIEQSPASILITDITGTIEYVNPAFTNLTGYTLEEAKDNTPRILKSGKQSDEFYEELWGTITSGKVWRGELYNVKKNGDFYWERATISPVFDGKGNIINYLAIKEDITDHKKTQVQLYESEFRLKTLSDNLPDGFVYEINSGTDDSIRKIEYISAGVEKLFGITAEQAMADPMSIYGKFFEEDAIKHATLEAECFRTMSNLASQIRFYGPDGETRWLLAYSSPRKTDNGEVVWDGIAMDITHQKEIEQKIKESEQKFKIVSENTYHWEFWEREDGSFIYNSPSCERITGYAVTEFEDPELLIQIIHPDDRKHYKEHRLKTWEDPGPDYCSFRIYHKNGDLRYIEHVCQPVFNEKGEFIGIRGTNIDITERKKIEQRLIESEKRFREIFETLPVISVQGYDCNRKVIYWNKASEELYGYTRGEAMGQKLEDLIIPEEMRVDVIDNINNWVEHNIAIPSSELTLKKKDGSKVYVYSNHVMLKNLKDEYELFCIDVDFTELRKKSEEIKESELYHRSLLQTIPDMIFVISSNGKYLDYKITNKDSLLTAPKNFINKKVSQVIPKEAAGKQIKAIRESLKTGNTITFDYSVHIDGQEQFFNAKTAAFGEDKVIVTVRDITDYQKNLVRVKELLEVEEKQNESLREFTHIVSHNLRVHTANMSGVMSFMETEEPDLYENQMVQMLKVSADNLEETIQDLNDVLNIRESKNLKFENINLKKTVSGVVSQKEKTAGKKGIRIIAEIDSTIYLEVIPSYLDTILMHLVSNSIKYASPERKPYVKITASVENTEVRIQVADNGLGIDLEKHRDKLFGMYKKFHDKESKGLGLYIVKNQVEVMGGRIEVESEVNVGTRISVILPQNVLQNE